MRASVPGLPSPHPIGALLPAVYQEDDFVQRFTAGLDEVLAPVIATLDCLEAYLDPRLAPQDFVAWLAGWTGLPSCGALAPDRRRALTRRAPELLRTRGTVAGLRELLTHVLVDDADVTVEETGGGVTYSSVPGSAPVQAARPVLTVRVSTGDPARIAAVDALVQSFTPVHVAHRVESLTGGGGGRASQDEREGMGDDRRAEGDER
ncbi:phage tail protein [Streptomyces sp. TRM70350]|uniref:phage tail protein n=1 Tax=Streptomyces sp. TRM70350 TaxID=2856165 RepID=UPI001C4534DB|nr:phage tail protein [Streptomyces sp. TRM70350]MBV7696565.1 phage tail protein [Streptomyces sp. TRM70350]